MLPLDRASPLPLWAQLVEELRRRLLGGELAGRLPPEPQLAAEYGVSRQTVREAIRRLREAGLLTAERGRGTFVRGPEVAPAPEAAGPRSLIAALETAGPELQVGVRVLDRAADARVAAALGLAGSGAALIHLERLWTAGGVPVAHDRVWLPEAAAAPLLDVDFRECGVHQALERWCGIRVDAGTERIGLATPTGEPRRLLGLEKRQPALVVERRGCTGDRPVEWGETLLRADRCGLVLEWSPAGGRCAVDSAPGTGAG